MVKNQAIRSTIWKAALILLVGGALGMVGAVRLGGWVGDESPGLLYWSFAEGHGALFRLDVERRLTVRLASPPDYRLINPPQLSPDGSHILFEVDRDGDRALFITTLSGDVLFESDRRSATRLPVWSPDGQEIAFWSTRDGFWRFYRMDWDGSGRRQISTRVGLMPYTYPLWSPDGQRILFRLWAARFGATIFLLDLRDGSTRDLTERLSAAGDLAWSPDGMRLAFRSEKDRNGEVYLLDVVSGALANLTHHPAIDFQPAWSPDGQEIVFVSTRSGPGELFVMRADGSNVRQITHGGGWQPVWSPAGDLIAFVSRRDGSDALYVVRPDGSGLRPVLRLTQQIIFLGWQRG
jgi:TolB protein